MIWLARLIWVLLLVGPCAALVGVGLEAWANEPPGYDMPGFGMMFYGFLAVVWAGIWVLVSVAVAALRQIASRVPERVRRYRPAHE